MEATSFSFSDLSRFLKRAPKIQTYIIPIALFIVADFFLIQNIYTLSVAFVLPLILVIALDRLFVYGARFNFPQRRINYLDFMSFFFAEIYFVILRLAFPGFLDLEFEIMLAFSTTGLLRSMVLYTYYSEKFRNIVLPSLIYTLAIMVGLAFMRMNHLSYLYFILITLLFSTGGYIFADVSVRGFKEEFGQSPIKILNFFLNSRTPGSNEDAARKFFMRIYNVESTVPVKVVDIKKTDGTRKATLVFPYIHPGPFGNIGTSNIPYKLQQRLPEIESDLLVFHTTTTNSNNSASESDIDGIAEAARTALSKVEYQDTISEFKSFEVDGNRLGLLKFGEFGLAAMIPEGKRFDDVSLSEGLRMIESMKSQFAKDFITVDSQINFLQGAQPLNNLDEMIETAEKEFPALSSDNRARIGYSRKLISANAMGPMGIQCLVLENKKGMQALVLTDSNNIMDTLIELSRSKVKDTISDIEFFTSDNHYINAGTLDMNPLGQRDDINAIAEAIAECVKDAIEDVEDCSLGMATEYTQVSMGEENIFKRLLESVRGSLRKARTTIILVILICLFSSVSLTYLMYYVWNFI